MRLKLLFELENTNFPVQYRKSIVSFLKKSTKEYNEGFYKTLYNEKDPIIKNYTFSVFLSNPKFEKDNIILSNNNIEVVLSTSDYNHGVNLYNAVNHQKNIRFSLNKNSMTLKKIYMLPEKEITSEQIQIKFLSPLCVREHNKETKKDYYYSYGREEFKNMLKINIKEQLKITSLDVKLLESFNIIAINYKKTVVPTYEKMIETTLRKFYTYRFKRITRLLI